ncbi:MAG: tyrosine-type recombinase/integrase [Hyphomicrobiales bacterium]|nr:tyrosine-type recombinase/integrase [Hyphomicrobiales bacterium]
MKTKRLGRYLEWHGAKIRVRIAVPAVMRAKVGKAHIKVPLHTADPLEAEILKGPIVARIMSELRGVEVAKSKEGKAALERALLWRDALSDPTGSPEEVDPRSVMLDSVIEPLRQSVGEEYAARFLAVADGKATPIATVVDQWVSANRYQGHTEAKARHSVAVLVKWCEKSNIFPCFELIDRPQGSRFVLETYISKQVNSATANDHISWITRLWKWHRANSSWTGENFWSELRISDKAARRMGERKRSKRPFTNEEVKSLLSSLSDGKSQRTLLDFITILALSGLRTGELAALRVSDIFEDCFHVRFGKTEAAERVVPIHSSLCSLVERRTQGKSSGDYLFDDLPGSENTKRRRGASVSQSFSRYRRKLGIGEKGANSRQDTADMHSFRRWFIDRAKARLVEPGIGYTGWTIAEVVGHNTDDEPLGLTMSVYAGPSSREQLRSCVQAVSLPV